MRVKKVTAIKELSNEVAGRDEHDERLAVRHTLVLEVRLAGQEPVRVSIVYVEAVRDGQECPNRVTRIDRSGVPRPVRALARQVVLEHLGKRFQVCPGAWPPEPILFKAGDVILSIHGDAWKFTHAGAIRFLRAGIRHESTGMDRDRPIASNHGGVLIEGVPVLALHYDDDWSAENLQELIRGLGSRKVNVAGTTNKGDLA